MRSIQELYEINKTVSPFSLIKCYLSLKYYAALTILIILLIGLFTYLPTLDNPLHSIISFIKMTIGTIIILILWVGIVEMIDHVIKKHYADYLSSKDKTLFEIISTIQVAKFKEQILSEAFYEKETLLFFINTVKKDIRNAHHYSSIFATAVVFPFVISSILIVLGKIESPSLFFYFFIFLIILLFFIFITLFILEKYTDKTYISIIESPHRRLIKILDSIYIETYFQDIEILENKTKIKNHKK
ncbi:MAG: hypothetical protein ACWIPH_00690 [Ostreibacterium sp.]